MTKQEKVLRAFEGIFKEVFFGGWSLWDTESEFLRPFHAI